MKKETLFCEHEDDTNYLFVYETELLQPNNTSKRNETLLNAPKNEGAFPTAAKIPMTKTRTNINVC